MTPLFPFVYQTVAELDLSLRRAAAALALRWSAKRSRARGLAGVPRALRPGSGQIDLGHRAIST